LSERRVRELAELFRSRSSEKMKSGRAFRAARGRPSGPAYPNLQAMIAKARAHEAEAEGRRLQWPLLGLIPLSVNAEVVRRAAERGELIAEQKVAAMAVGSRWLPAWKTGLRRPVDGSRAKPPSSNGARPFGVGLARFEAWDNRPVRGAY
jgi:hypothetical protein